jgi:hypothetical protein
MSDLDLSASIPPVLVSWLATLPEEAVAGVSEHLPAVESKKLIQLRSFQQRNILILFININKLHSDK